MDALPSSLRPHYATAIFRFLFLLCTFGLKKQKERKGEERKRGEINKGER